MLSVKITRILQTDNLEIIHAFIQNYKKVPITLICCNHSSYD